MHYKETFRQNKRLIGIMLAATLLLMIPGVAKILNNNMLWDETDFIVAGLLLFGTGLLFELAARNAAKAHSTTAYKAGAGIGLGAGLFLIWSNLAVGIIGSEDNPVNKMYFGVIAIGLIGAAISRLRPLGMARTMFAMAIAQALVPVIALIINRPPINSTEALFGVLGVFGINGFFIVLFVVSGLLFLRANAPRSSPEVPA